MRLPIWSWSPQVWAMDERRSLFRPSSSPSPINSPRPRSVGGGPVFSKDGTKIFASGSTPGGQLVRFDARSNRLQPFLSGISAEFVAYPKDGDSVVYVSYPDGILWKAKPDGSDRVQLSAPPMRPRLVNVSPDGTQITVCGFILLRVSPKPTSFLPRGVPRDGFCRTIADQRQTPIGRPMVVTSPSRRVRKWAKMKTAPFVSSM